jgi:hypothetical protein
MESDGSIVCIFIFDIVPREIAALRIAVFLSDQCLYLGHHPSL